MLTRKKASVNDKGSDKDEKVGGLEADASVASTVTVPSQLVVALSIAEQTKRSPATLKRSAADAARPRSKRVRREQSATSKQWEVWSDDDKDVFFQALQEFGKDFDKIHKFIIQKLKNRADAENKTRDQVRHFYYRTWRWLEKYVNFSDGIDKAAAELFGLVNYGELRKKLGARNGMNGKNAEKLRELIHYGSTTVKAGGKKIRLKTPTCRALKKLFKIADDKTVRDKVKVPEYVTVELQPRDGNSWTLVQMMAHNPHVRVKVKAKQTLDSLLDFMQKKWVPHRVRLKEHYKDMEPSASELKVFPPSSVKLKEYKLKTIKPLAAKKMELTVDSYLSTVIGKGKVSRLAAEQASTYTSSEVESVAAGTYGSSVNPASVNGPESSVVHLGTGTQPASVAAAPAVPAATTVPGRTVAGATDLCNGHCQPGGSGVPPAAATTGTFFTLLTFGEKFLTARVESAAVEAAGDLAVQSALSRDCSEEMTGDEMKELARGGWTAKSSRGITIAELYLLFGASDKVLLEYVWLTTSSYLCDDEPATSASNASSKVPPLRRLVQLAKNESLDQTRKAHSSPSVTKGSPSVRQKGRGMKLSATAPAATSNTLGGSPSTPKSSHIVDAAAASIVTNCPMVMSASVSLVGGGSESAPVDSGSVFRIPMGPGMLRSDAVATRQVSIDSLTRLPMVTNRNVRNRIVRKPLLVQRTLLPSSQAMFCVVPTTLSGSAVAVQQSALVSKQPATDVLSAAMAACGVLSQSSPSMHPLNSSSATVEGANDKHTSSMVTSAMQQFSHESSLPTGDSLSGIVLNGSDIAAASTGGVHTVQLLPVEDSAAARMASARRRITAVPVTVASSVSAVEPFGLETQVRRLEGNGSGFLSGAAAASRNAGPLLHKALFDSPQPLSTARNALFESGAHETFTNDSSLTSLLHSSPLEGSDARMEFSFTGLLGTQMKPSAGLASDAALAGGASKDWLTADVSMSDFSLSSMSSLLTSSAEKSPDKRVAYDIGHPTAALDDASRMSFLSKFDAHDVASDMAVDNALHCLMSESSMDYISKFEDLANQISLDTPQKKSTN